MLAALMAIGLNSILGAVFGAMGLGFLGAFLVAPVTEEVYKGSGVAILSEHKEFNSIEEYDGYLQEKRNQRRRARQQNKSSEPHQTKR